MMLTRLADGILWYFAFLFSITVHEAAHALVAHRMGDSTARDAGQVTLSPIPHVLREPIGTVVVPIFSFLLGGWMIGWANTPYDVRWSLEYPKRAARMALAGPAANLLVVLLAAFAVRMGLLAGIFRAPGSVGFTRIVSAAGPGVFSAAAIFLSVFFSLNLILFFFNLLPVPPLDGSGILPLFMSDERAGRYLEVARNPSFSFIGIMIAWKLFGVIYSPLHLACVNLLLLGEASYH